MKKTFRSRIKTALASAVIAGAGASAASADVVAINFMGDGYGAVGAPVTATAFGVDVADWTDVDAADANGSVELHSIGSLPMIGIQVSQEQATTKF